MCKAMREAGDEFFLNGPHGRLFVTAQAPAGGGPAVILCHGISATCEKPILLELARDLAEAGIGVVRFDFDGRGKSDGKFEDMTIPGEMEDLKTVLQWTSEQPWAECVAIAGHSQGGLVAAMVAGELGFSRVRALGLLAPATSLRDDAIRGRTMDAVYDPWNVPETTLIPSKGLQLGRNYVLSLQNLPIFETVFNYDGPVFILQGIHDRIVPYTCAERLQAGYRQSKLKLVPDEDHSFTRFPKDDAQLVCSFFVGELRGHNGA